MWRRSYLLLSCSKVKKLQAFTFDTPRLVTCISNQTIAPSIRPCHVCSRFLRLAHDSWSEDDRHHNCKSQIMKRLPSSPPPPLPPFFFFLSFFFFGSDQDKKVRQCRGILFPSFSFTKFNLPKPSQPHTYITIFPPWCKPEFEKHIVTIGLLVIMYILFPFQLSFL